MLLLNLAARVAAAVLNVPPDALAFLPMVAPLPSSPLDAARRSASTVALDRAWFDDRIGFDIPEEDSAFVDEAASANLEDIVGEDGEVDLELAFSRPSTYGEVTALGARQLYGYMGMSGPYRPPKRRWDADKDVGGNDGSVSFFDLGSGAGRLVVQSYMELPRLRRSVGVELSPARHAAAERAWYGLSEDGTAQDARNGGGVNWKRGGGEGSVYPDAAVEFVEGDLFKLDVSDATHIYVASLCFTPDMMQRLADKLQGEAGRLQCVATLKQFPAKADVEGKGKLGKPRMEYVEMSWTKDRGEGCGVYFYTP